MEETKENVKQVENKPKEKPSIGDIIFRVLILVTVFFICVIAYTFYIKGVM